MKSGRILLHMSIDLKVPEAAGGAMAGDKQGFALDRDSGIAAQGVTGADSIEQLCLPICAGGGTLALGAYVDPHRPTWHASDAR